jgi:hypothetical protein
MEKPIYRFETVTKAELARMHMDEEKVCIKIIPLAELYVKISDVLSLLNGAVIEGISADRNTPVKVWWMQKDGCLGLGATVHNRNILTIFSFVVFPFGEALADLCDLATDEKKVSVQDVQASSNQT